MSGIGAFFDRISTWITVAVLVLCPLPFGSVDLTWIAIWCLALSLAVLLADLRPLRSGHSFILVIVFAAAALFSFVILLQSVPNPLVAPNEIWERAGDILGRAFAGTVSVNVAETVRGLGSPLLVFLTFAAVFVAAADRSKARLITAAVLYSGTFYAALGLFQAVVTPETLLWMPKLDYVGDLTGPFVNRNTAATYFGCILILWTVRLIDGTMERMGASPDNPQTVRFAPTDFLNIPFAVDLVCLLLCLFALVFTHSRAGTILSFVALFLAVMLQVSGYLRGRLNWIVAGGAAVVLAAVLLELLAGGVAMRISGLGLVDQSRLSVYDSALTIITDQPLLGTGLGTFADVFPIYRNPEVGAVGVWAMAHNTPLELASELGVPLTAVIIGLWVAGLVRLVRAGVTTRRGNVFVIAAFGTGLLGCLHSLVDFSPQIPGFAIVWVALFACGLAQSLPRRKRKSAPYQGFDRPSQPPAAAPLGAANG